MHSFCLNSEGAQRNREHFLHSQGNQQIRKSYNHSAEETVTGANFQIHKSIDYKSILKLRKMGVYFLESRCHQPAQEILRQKTET